MFKDKLKSIRRSKGLTMDTLCKIYNEKYDGKMNKSTLSRYENGLQTPMFTVVKNLADILNVPIGMLTDEEEYFRFEVSEEEKSLLQAYRDASPEVQKVIRKLIED